MDRLMTCNMGDDWMFDDKYLDFDQDLDSLNLSLWQPNGFTVGSSGDTDEPMKIEDIFQTDIADYTNGPTLAELNLVDDKLDSADLDEYLNNDDNNNYTNISNNNTNNPMDSPAPKANLMSSSKNGNTHGCYSNATISTTNTASANEITDLTVEEIEQLVSMTESSNPNEDDFNSVCVDVSLAQAPTTSSSSWDNTRTCLSSLPATDSHQNKKGKLSTIEELPQPATSSSSASKIISSMPTAPVIIKEPSSPEMDLSNLVICTTPLPEVKQEEPNDEDTSEDSDKVPYNSQLSPEYLEQRTRRRTNSFSTECSFSSHDEGFASQQEDADDNDQENDESDDESFYRDYEPEDLLGARTSDDSENKWALDMGRSRKSGQQRYFWQYNVQSKGPKGTRIISLSDICNDPHVLMEAKDPVFSSECHVEGVKHAGKARRGDGNDLTPNPKKLLMIGLELKKLSRIINELTPVAQVPATSRNKSRKEKNKLASRACRLKKKAQHEANKIKLYGLQQEHKRMMNVLTDVQNLANEVVEEGVSAYEHRLTDMLEQIVALKGPRVKVAGNTAEFVNSVLDNVSSGCSDGGLNQL